MLRLLIVLSVAALAAPVGAQTSAGDGRMMESPPPGSTWFGTQADGRLVGERIHDPTAEARVIVRLSEPSLAEAWGRTAARTADAASSAQVVVEAQQARFRADLSRLAASATKSGRAAAEVRADYSRTLNALAVVTTQEVVAAIRRLPYVVSVTEDREIQIDNTPREGAWSPLRRGRAGSDTGTGEGVVVAVLDTGVDYTRDDLGAGFGPDHRVIGGYDFVNRDGDPADDFGHGTAVAGVIAANGPSFQGAAPDAQILAYKVCDGSGRCFVSSILSGIDAAVDPDRSPATDDGADLLNLSLGSPLGNADDPIPVALDGAAALGSLPVVAAGNEGEFGYHSMGSVAASRGVLTVGAVTFDDQIAPFSSRGPTRREYAIKPEIVAPGVDVPAPALGGTYGTYTGTSLAAPVVTGAAALLVEQRPDWEPDVLKAALAQSAVDMGLDLWTQGLGRLDGPAALDRTVVVTPTTLALGVVDLNQPVWTGAQTVTLHNVGPAVATVSLTAETQVGVSASFAPAAATLAPGSSVAVEVTVQVDTQVVPSTPISSGPYGNPTWLPYTGAVVASVGDAAIRVPFSFVQSPTLDVAVEDFFPSVAVLNDEGLLLQDTDPNASFVVPEGTYDVVVSDGGLYAVLEGVEVSGATAVHISEDDLATTLSFDLRDASDASVRDPDVQALHLVHTPSGTGFSQLRLLSGSAPEPVEASALSDDYRLDTFTYTRSGATTAYQFNGSFQSIDQDRVLTNRGQDLVPIDVAYRRTRRSETVTPVWPLATLPLEHIGIWVSWEQDPTLAPPFEQRIYTLPPGTPDHWSWAYAYPFSYVFSPTSGTTARDATLLYVAPGLRSTPDGDIVATSPFDGSAERLAGRDLVYGMGPTHWAALFDNPDSGTTIRIRSHAGGGARLFESVGTQQRTSFPFFAGQHYERPFTPDQWLTVKDADGAQIASGPLEDFLLLEETQTGPPNQLAGVEGLAPGRYTVVLGDDSMLLAGVPSATRVQATMDLSLPDADPPTLRALSVLGDGAFTDRLAPDQTGVLRIQAADAEGSVAVEAQLRRVGGTWTDLALTADEAGVQAALPGTLEGGFYEVRVQAEDASGNRLDLTARPAFVKSSGETQTPTEAPTLASPTDGASGIGASVALAWGAIADAYGYRLQVARDPDFADLVRDTLAAAAETTVEVPSGETLYWRARGANARGAGPWSATRSFATAMTVAAEGAPVAFTSAPAFPNPFHRVITVPFSLPSPESARVVVFDALGRRLATLLDQDIAAGHHRVRWDSRDAPSGVYLIRVTAGPHTAMHRVVLAR